MRLSTSGKKYGAFVLAAMSLALANCLNDISNRARQDNQQATLCFVGSDKTPCSNGGGKGGNSCYNSGGYNGGNPPFNPGFGGSIGSGNKLPGRSNCENINPYPGSGSGGGSIKPYPGGGSGSECATTKPYPGGGSGGGTGVGIPGGGSGQIGGNIPPCGFGNGFGSGSGSGSGFGSGFGFNGTGLTKPECQKCDVTQCYEKLPYLDFDATILTNDKLKSIGKGGNCGDPKESGFTFNCPIDASDKR